MQKVYGFAKGWKRVDVQDSKRPGALRGGECGVFAQMEDRRWVHRNCGRERVSVCGVSSKCADGNERLCAVAVGTFVSIDDDRVEKTRF